MDSSSLLKALRHALLIKVLARHAPTRAAVTSVIEFMASKLVAAVQAQSITFYIVEGNHISFTQVCYSPSLWAGDVEKEKRLREAAAEMLSLKIPRGRGIVGKVIETGEPVFFRNAELKASPVPSLADAGFQMLTMLTVPLKTTMPLGAIEVLNKEVEPGSVGEFTEADLAVLEEFAEYLAALLHRVIDPKFQVDSDRLARFAATLTELPLVARPEELEFDETLIASVGEPVIRREQIIPWKRLGENGLAVLVTNPLDFAKREAFSEATGMLIEEVSVISATGFETLVRRHFKRTDAGAAPADDLSVTAVAEAISESYRDAASTFSTADLEREDSAPIIQMTNRIIEDAHMCGASDIHIEPTEKELLIRYRVDGLCQDKLRLPREAARAMIARVKIMCNLDIAETRLPQDGRIVFKKFSKKNINVDVRVAVCPVNHGEKIVMRILDKSKTALPLTALGFSDDNLLKYRDCIRQPYGMILHCGPTGSGKSMTLYSALAEVNTPDMNIQTAEDPIEYTVPGLSQTQMNRQIGLTFARALRSYLRMDPDIILVGEIRDQETAQIAIEAALTGHLLLSTLHTNDAASTVSRLREMGIEPFNVASSLIAICAQRLVRRVCENCRIAYQPVDRQAEILQRALGWAGEIYKANPNGCPRCGGTGYKGRVGIHELLVNGEELTAAINKEVEAAELKRIAMRSGMKTLHQDSMLKVMMGITTIEEALSQVPADQTPAAVPVVTAQFA